MKKYINPLSVKKDNADVQSTSAAGVKSESAFNVDVSDKCPKCGSDTVLTRLHDDEPIMFCTNCRVSLAIKEE